MLALKMHLPESDVIQIASNMWVTSRIERELKKKVNNPNNNVMFVAWTVDI